MTDDDVLDDDEYEDDDLDDEDDDDLEDDLDDEDDDDLEDDDDAGNRIVGARARAVVDYVVTQLADDPDAVEIELSERGDLVTVTIHADPGDIGRIIGRRGRVIQAIRQVARAAGSAEDVRVSVEVAE